MGIAVVRVTRDVLPESLLMLAVAGSLLSVTYPLFWLDPVEVRVATNLVPDGEHAVSAEITRSVDEAAASLTLRFKVET